MDHRPGTVERMSEFLDAVRYWSQWNYAFLSHYVVLAVALLAVVLIALRVAYIAGASSAKSSAAVASAVRASSSTSADWGS